MRTRPKRIGLGVMAALFAILVAAPARAQDQPTPPPPLGAIKRVIKLGPEATVVQDEHGTITMAQEPPPKEKTNRDVLGPVFTTMIGGTMGSIASGPRYVAIGTAAGGAAFTE
jgi:hypothetical protein